MDQRTQDWHDWRAKGIGGSDISAVLGESPYKTRYQLWLVKTGKLIEEVDNFVVRRGTELEPKARALYELEYDLEMPAALFVHPEHSFARVSLDGYNKEANRILEIKYVGKDKHEQAKNNEVPAVFIPQVQWQLFVTGAVEAHYLSYYNEEIIVVHVLADSKVQELLLDEAKAFWRLVETNTPPALIDKDIRRLKKQEKMKAGE